MEEAGVYVVRTARQLRVLNSPARMAVVEAMIGSDSASVAEIGGRVAMSPESVRYHLSRLSSIGLVSCVGERGTGARPERLYALTAERIELTRERRGPAFREELARGGRLLLRMAEREFEQAVQQPSDCEPILSRVTGWVSPDELREVRELVGRLEAILSESAGRDRDARRAFSLTLVGAPLCAQT